MSSFAGSQTQTFWRWVMTKELLVSLFSSFWIVLWSFLSFFPTGDPERTFHSSAVCLQQLLFLKKCLLVIKAESFLGHGSTSLCQGSAGSLKGKSFRASAQPQCANHFRDTGVPSSTLDALSFLKPNSLLGRRTRFARHTSVRTQRLVQRSNCTSD